LAIDLFKYAFGLYGFEAYYQSGSQHHGAKEKGSQKLKEAKKMEERIQNTVQMDLD
jgi:hypothetical protein